MIYSLSTNSSLVSNEPSLGKYYANPNEPLLLGMMVNLSNGIPVFKNQLTTACPLSCTATTFFSYLDKIDFFSTPAITLSVAFSKSSLSTYALFFRLAWMAASLHRLAMSAPLNPGVNVASLLAYSSIDYDASNLSGFKCNMNIYFLLSISGSST